MTYHLRLSKGLSYCGVISATKRQPDVYTDSKDVADRAVASGYFRLVGQAEPSVPAPTPEPEPTREPEYDDVELQTGTLDAEQLSAMNLSELRRLAAQMGIEAKGLGKPELVKAIAAVEVIPGSETDEDGIDLSQA